ncbi:MAG TPA: nucleotidyltransferase domain-containing protein [Bacillota bacterium]|nr:nucleotidyltransferase domain-containing protein [Bacillota bacterium]
MAIYSDDITRIKDIIVREYQPDAIILFGSHARNSAKPESDIDIIVISDREKQLPRHKRGLNVRIQLSEVKTPKDILFYTHEDVERWRGVKHTFVETILKEGKVLYER